MPGGCFFLIIAQALLLVFHIDFYSKTGVTVVNGVLAALVIWQKHSVRERAVKGYCMFGMHELHRLGSFARKAKHHQ